MSDSVSLYFRLGDGALPYPATQCDDPVGARAGAGI